MKENRPEGEKKGPPTGRRSSKRTAVVVAGGVFLALFFVVWALVAYSRAVASSDAALELFINSHQGGALTSVMVFASLYGREYFWIPVVAVMLVFGKKDVKVLAIELAVVFAVGVVCGEALKEVYFRERPFLALGSAIAVPPGIPPDSDSSFPSGHAVVVSIGACFVLWKFFLTASAGAKARAVSLLLTVEAAVVCYSRAYNGLHYPLDVVAGVFLACAVVLLVGALLDAYFALWLRKLADVVHYVTSTLLRIPEVI